MPDSELVAAARKGDDVSFELLVERYLKTVYNFCVRLLGNAADAEDVVQTTFLKTWSNLSSFQQGANFKSWLLAIARNAAIDVMRKKRDIPFSMFTDTMGNNVIENAIDDTELLPEELLVRAEQKNALEELLQKLPMPQREVLLLHYTEYLTFAKIGKILHEPANTVKSRHARGIRLLRTLMTKMHQNNGPIRIE